VRSLRHGEPLQTLNTKYYAALNYEPVIGFKCRPLAYGSQISYLGARFFLMNFSAASAISGQSGREMEYRLLPQFRIHADGSETGMRIHARSRKVWPLFSRKKFTRACREFSSVRRLRPQSLNFFDLRPASISRGMISAVLLRRYFRVYVIEFAMQARFRRGNEAFGSWFPPSYDTSISRGTEQRSRESSCNSEPRLGRASSGSECTSSFQLNGT